MNVCVFIFFPAAVVDRKTHETGAKQCLPHLEVDRRRQLNQRALPQQAQRVSRWPQPCKPMLLIKCMQSHGYTRTSTSARTRTSTCTCTRTHQSLKVIGATVILCVVLIDSKQLLLRDIDCYRGVFCVCVLCMRVLCMHTSAHSKRQRCSKTCRCVQWEQKKWGGE